MELNFEGLEIPDEAKEALSNQLAEMQKGMVSREEFEAVNSKKEQLLSETKAAKEARRIEAEEKERAEMQAAAKNGDVEALQKALEEQKNRYNELQTSIVEQNDKNKEDDFINKFLAENVTNDPAARLFIETNLRAKVAVKNGELYPVDKDGALTGQSLSELAAALVSDPSNAAYMLASKADGGGATGSKVNASGVDLSKMNKTELSIYALNNPEKYQAWADQQH